ncbi:helix-turn-helix domain-containing protein [Actinocorallia sp. B10E7]|uniref:TetR/AcrR family transcriptional regulator n=1 Tax=Actinocorallia sp. B10E7 TaxID=3153558 RepID=UPI00325E73FA
MAPRATKNDYFDVAMRVLAEEGYPALKQANLCKALGVTTGSFYNHFQNWQDFTGQLLDKWRKERTSLLAAAASRTNDPAKALDLLRELALSLPHRAEAAIRAWSLIDPQVAEVQALVDRERLDAVQHAMDALFSDRETSTGYARTAFYVLVGFEQFEGDSTDPHHLNWAFRRLLEHIEERRDL